MRIPVLDRLSFTGQFVVFSLAVPFTWDAQGPGAPPRQESARACVDIESCLPLGLMALAGTVDK